jgi:hypothetical protein
VITDTQERETEGSQLEASQSKDCTRLYPENNLKGQGSGSSGRVFASRTRSSEFNRQYHEEKKKKTEPSTFVLSHTKPPSSPAQESPGGPCELRHDPALVHLAESWFAVTCLHVAQELL